MSSANHTAAFLLLLLAVGLAHAAKLQAMHVVELRQAAGAGNEGMRLVHGDETSAC